MSTLKLDGESTFFTSDTHYGHKLMFEKMRADWGLATLEEHDEYMIDVWNDTVGPTDTVFHLGDFSFRSKSDTAAIIKRLHGRKFFIRGNHDSVMRGYVLNDFEWTGDYKEIKVEDRHVVLMHFPIASWHHVHRGAIHLHGHCHGNLPDDGTMARLDVGIDNHPYQTPYSWSLVEALVGDRTGLPGDHHGVHLADM